MQEEVEQKTIALSVRTARMTATVLQQAMRRFLDAQKHKEKELPHVKQTLKQLMKQNTGVSSLEVNYDNIKDFESTAKKYGIDFALKKDAMETPPKYIVFFKGRDAEVMTEAFKEFTAKSLTKEKKPSIKKTLSVLKDQMEKTNKHREKVKQKDRGVELADEKFNPTTSGRVYISSVKEDIRNPYTVGNQVYIETNLSSDYIIQFCYKVIDEMGLDREDLEIILEEK